MGLEESGIGQLSRVNMKWNAFMANKNQKGALAEKTALAKPASS